MNPLLYLPASGAWDRPTPDDPAPAGLDALCDAPDPLVERRGGGWYRLTERGVRVREEMDGR